MNEHQLFQFYLELKKNYVPVPANPKTVKNAPLFSQTSPNIAYQIDRDYDGFLNRGISYDYDEKTNQKVVDLLERISTSKYYHLSIVQENFDTVRFVARTVSIINGEKPVYHFVITFRKDEDISFTTYPQTEEERKEICKYEKMENGSILFLSKTIIEMEEFLGTDTAILNILEGLDFDDWNISYVAALVNPASKKRKFQ